MSRPNMDAPGVVRARQPRTKRPPGPQDGENSSVSLEAQARGSTALEPGDRRLTQPAGAPEPRLRGAGAQPADLVAERQEDVLNVRIGHEHLVGHTSIEPHWPSPALHAFFAGTSGSSASRPGSRRGYPPCRHGHGLGGALVRDPALWCVTRPSGARPRASGADPAQPGGHPLCRHGHGLGALWCVIRPRPGLWCHLKRK